MRLISENPVSHGWRPLLGAHIKASAYHKVLAAARSRPMNRGRRWTLIVWWELEPLTVHRRQLIRLWGGAGAVLASSIVLIGKLGRVLWGIVSVIILMGRRGVLLGMSSRRTRWGFMLDSGRRSIGRYRRRGSRIAGCCRRGSGMCGRCRRRGLRGGYVGLRRWWLSLPSRSSVLNILERRLVWYVRNRALWLRARGRGLWRTWLGHLLRV